MAAEGCGLTADSVAVQALITAVLAAGVGRHFGGAGN